MRLESHLSKSRNVQFEYLTAPFPIDADTRPPPPSIKPHKDGCQWWKLPPNARSFTATEYLGIEQSLRLIEDTWRSKGPFDAIAGHSQGAIIISIVLAKALAQDYVVKPSKAIFWGAAWARPFDELLKSAKEGARAKGEEGREGGAYEPRTLHVYDPDDEINPAEMALAVKEVFQPWSEEMEHGGRHDIPQDEEALARYASFLFSSPAS
eukprot:2434697-Rhodomonas_salina.2